MVEQLHKRFTDDQIKLLLDLYLRKALTLDEILIQLGCGRTRFFQLLKKYRNTSVDFTIAYCRHKPQHQLPEEVDNLIRKELETEYQLIRDPKTTITQFNYAYLTDCIRKQLNQPISAQTVRNRAKEWGYYIPARKKEKRPPRHVLTNAPGMLLQHDSSHHKWTPYVAKEWTLITTLDDYSRLMLYADLVEHDTTWAHIKSLESVVLNYGVAVLCYVDSHRIFRFVAHGESFWQHQRIKTDEALTQWRRVVEKCGMKVIYALSARAKGKVERPYRWLQDRIVRRCAREQVDNIEQARVILQDEQKRYNYHQVHSTTGEIPQIRFQNALKEGCNCFKPFQLLPPYQSVKDIFCLHKSRKVDGYNQIWWAKQKIKLPIPLAPGTEIELHIVPNREHTEIRFWYKDRVIQVMHFKSI